MLHAQTSLMRGVIFYDKDVCSAVNLTAVNKLAVRYVMTTVSILTRTCLCLFWTECCYLSHDNVLNAEKQSFLLPPVWTLTRNVANQPFKTCRVQLLTYLHVSAHDRIELWALPEWLRDGGQPFLWRGRGGGRRLCHVKQPLQQPHQHVAGGSPWRQGRGSTQRDHKAQVSSGAFFWMDCWPTPNTRAFIRSPSRDEQTRQRARLLVSHCYSCIFFLAVM